MIFMKTSENAQPASENMTQSLRKVILIRPVSSSFQETQATCAAQSGVEVIQIRKMGSGTTFYQNGSSEVNHVRSTEIALFPQNDIIGASGYSAGHSEVNTHYTSIK